MKNELSYKLNQPVFSGSSHSSPPVIEYSRQSLGNVSINSKRNSDLQVSGESIRSSNKNSFIPNKNLQMPSPYGPASSRLISLASGQKKGGYSNNFSLDQEDIQIDSIDSFSMSGNTANERTPNQQQTSQRNLFELKIEEKAENEQQDNSSVQTPDNNHNNNNNNNVSESQISADQDSQSSLSAFKLTMMGRYDELKQFCRESNLSYIQIVNERGNSLVIKAVQNKDISGVRQLVEEARYQLSEQGFSSAHIEIEIAEWINRPSNCGYTAAHFACYVGDIDILILLHELGADFTALSHTGSNGLHVAIENDSISSIIFLILLGIDINFKDSKSATALHCASYQGQYQSVQFLIAFGASVNEQDSEGLTPLILSAVNGSMRIVRLLLLAGADKTLTDNQSRTALQIVEENSENDNTDIVEMLKRTSGFQEYWNIRPVFKPTDKSPTQIIYFILLLIFALETLTFFNSKLWDQNEELGVGISLNILMIITSFFFLNSWLRDPGHLSKKNKKNSQIVSPAMEAEIESIQEILSKKSPGAKNPAFSMSSGSSNLTGFQNKNTEMDDGTKRKLLELICLLRKENNSSNICAHCCLVKPKRSRHCDVCGECVSVYDHHCPWINNCVGTKNHFYFLGFVISIWIMILFYLVVIVYYVWRTDYHDSTLDTFGWISSEYKEGFLIAKWILSGICAFFCVLFGVPLTLLLFVQIENFLQNKTTFERFSLQSRASHLTESGLTSSLISNQNINAVEASQLRKSLLQESTKSTIVLKENKSANCLSMGFQNKRNPEYFIKYPLESTLKQKHIEEV